MIGSPRKELASELRTGVFSRVLQRNGTNDIYIVNVFINYKELAHAIMEAEKSHDLSPVS